MGEVVTIITKFYNLKEKREYFNKNRKRLKEKPFITLTNGTREKIFLNNNVKKLPLRDIFKIMNEVNKEIFNNKEFKKK